MDITIKANKDILLKNLLKENHFSDKLITELQNNGLNTLVEIKSGKSIIITLPDEESDVLAEKGPLNIVYEDQYIIVLNKDSNIASIPSKRHYEHNLSNLLMNYYNEHNIKSKIHPINRLDFKTNGLIMFAKSRYIHSLFSILKIEKYYKASLKGHLEIKEGFINLPILDSDNMKRKIDMDGKQSITQYKVTSYTKNTTNIIIKLLTGRTHQIRRHFSYLGYPLIGDDLYGNDSNNNLQLKCYKLNFIHPITNQIINIEI